MPKFPICIDFLLPCYVQVPGKDNKKTSEVGLPQVFSLLVKHSVEAVVVTVGDSGLK